MKRKLLIRVFTFIALGFLASIVITQSIAAYHAYRHSRPGAPSNFVTSDSESPGSSLVGSRFTIVGIDFCAAARMDRQGPAGVRDLPAWFPLPPTELGEATGAMAMGLPLRCFTANYNFRSGLSASPRAIEYRHGVLLTLPGLSNKTVFPTKPLLRGLIANSLFYAALFAGLSFSTRHLRRTLRRRRGHCAFCNYDLSGSSSGACPECGRARDLGQPSARAERAPANVTDRPADLGPPKSPQPR